MRSAAPVVGAALLLGVGTADAKPAQCEVKGGKNAYVSVAQADVNDPARGCRLSA